MSPNDRFLAVAGALPWPRDRIVRVRGRLAGRGWIGPKWSVWPGWLDSAWVVVSLLNLVAVLVFGHWETMPFHLIWISLTVIYGFRVWATYPTLWVLLALMVAISAATVLDVWTGTERLSGLTEVPLMTVMFLTVAWHARREAAANHRWNLISEENGRLLANQRRFLQDAAHQLRTPITIALGHAELLARELPDAQQGQDINVVLGELTRLRRIAERLLVIAASEAPDFLTLEPVDLDRFTMEAIRRWRPTAPRRWQLGRLDPVTVQADRERLGEAVDALLDNAVRHTGPDDVIKLSVVRGADGGPARLAIADGGSGIPAGHLSHIFERFRTVGDDASRGTGLGLALVRAVARAHRGDVRVRSVLGRGTEFELLLPVAGAGADHAGPAPEQAKVGTVQTGPGPAEMADNGTAPPGTVHPGIAPSKLRHVRTVSNGAAPPGSVRPGPGHAETADDRGTLNGAVPAGAMAPGAPDADGGAHDHGPAARPGSGGADLGEPAGRLA